MENKGQALIVIARSKSGCALTVCGKRRGAPMTEKKCAQKLEEYKVIVIRDWHYSSFKIIEKRV